MKKDFYNIYEEGDASQSDHSDIQDDEEIDEDLVFNESDEERFGSHFDKKIQDSDIDASDDALDDALDDDYQEHLDQLIKRENLQNLINPMQSEIKTSNANPWLADDISEPLQKSFKSASADPSSKAIAKIQKHKKKLESSIEYGIIQPDSNLNEELANSEDNQPEIACDAQTSDHVQSDSDEDSDENHEDLDLFQPANIKSLTHSDIMKMTFENDNVVEEFEDEKKKITERDLPKKEDLTLPGWGSWGGIGMKPPKEKVTREIPGIESSKRKDSKLSHVIINEKRMKKAIQYLVPQIPHGFENRDQYERTIRMPIGKEWNSQNIYLENIAPKIQKKLGVAIQPLKFVSTSRKSGNSNRRKF